MRAEHLRLEELVQFFDGLVDLHGRRLIILDLHALAQFRRDIIEMVGRDQARRIFTRLGYFWGQADAAAMKRIFRWENVTEWVKAGPMLHALQGAVKAEIKALDLDEAEKRFSMEVIWHDSGEAAEFAAELGTSAQHSCWIFVGYASGYSSFCLGKSVYFVERQCRGRGDPICFVVGKDIDSWDEEIRPSLEFFHADDIQVTIRTLTEQLREQQLEITRQRKELEQAQKGATIAAIEVRSRRFLQVLDVAKRVSGFDSSVLITGETGVGKEVLARYIHELSPRCTKSFVAVNCAALPETLLDSALFGHKAGAFTGATKDQLGLFEEAHKGTIFLDEIGDTTPATQLKLLRVLQEQEIMRVGETRPRKVDIRVIAATNRDLKQAVADGRLREDLYYRLEIVHIDVPPLRERTEDILPLARHFVKKYSSRFELPALKMDATCLDCLLEYSWPGNIRELENAIEHAAVLCGGEVILPEHIPSKIGRSLQSQQQLASPDGSLAEVEWDHIQRVLKLTDGNRAEAARILKISQATLYRRLQQNNDT